MSNMSVSSRDMQLREQKQTEEMKREQEQRLQSLQADYQRREDKIRDAGDAAILHIKKTTDERIENTREASQTQLKRENDQINKNYSDLRRRSAQQIASLDQQVNEAEDRANRGITNAEMNERSQIRKSQAELADFLEKQKEYRARERSALTAELEEDKLKANRDLVKQKKHQNEEMDRLRTKSTESRRVLEEQNRTNLIETREQAERRIVELRRQNEANYERERRGNTQSIEQLQERFQDNVGKLKRENDREISQLDRENKTMILENRENALRTNEKMLKEYSKEAQRVESTGQSDVNQRQEKFEKLLSKQEKDNAERLKQTELELARQESKLRTEHETKVQEQVGKMDLELQSQTESFKRSYDINDKTYKDSLDNQKQNYLKALYKQQQRYDQQLRFDSSRSGDPFYSLKTFDARLYERDGGYFVKGKVPPYDRETVEVRVQDGKIVLSARRSYENSVSDDEERRSTNTYQTYRQEFKLGVPVVAKEAVTKVEDDGTINVFVPKKGQTNRA